MRKLQPSSYLLSGCFRPKNLTKFAHTGEDNFPPKRIHTGHGEFYYYGGGGGGVALIARRLNAGNRRNRQRRTALDFGIVMPEYGDGATPQYWPKVAEPAIKALTPAS
jgi:hypothetical protein